MGRAIVVRRPRAAGDAAEDSSAGPPPTPDDYLGRLVKYVPAEVVALYLALTTLIENGGGVGQDRSIWLWGVFLGCVVATPIYLRMAMRRTRQPVLWTQIGISTLAFPIWAFAIGGFLEDTALYRNSPFLPSVLLMVATFVIPWFELPEHSS